MSVSELYHSFRKEFPEVTLKADKLYLDSWDGIVGDDTSAHIWFASLADALNKEMDKGVSANTYKGLFEFIQIQYLHGSIGVKECIDVSFTENLFWQVAKDKTQKYWLILPDALKELYVTFHGVKPT